MLSVISKAVLPWQQDESRAMHVLTFLLIYSHVTCAKGRVFLKETVAKCIKI